MKVNLMTIDTKIRTDYEDVKNIFFGHGFWILEFNIRYNGADINSPRPEPIIIHDDKFILISVEEK